MLCALEARLVPTALGMVVAPVWFPFLEQLTHEHPQEEGGGRTAGAKGTVGGLGCDGTEGGRGNLSTCKLLDSVASVAEMW